MYRSFGVNFCRRLVFVRIYSHYASKASEHHPNQTKESNLDRHHLGVCGECLFTAFDNAMGSENSLCVCVCVDERYKRERQRDKNAVYDFQETETVSFSWHHFYSSLLFFPAMVLCVCFVWEKERGCFVAKSKQSISIQTSQQHTVTNGCYSYSSAFDVTYLVFFFHV